MVSLLIFKSLHRQLTYVLDSLTVATCEPHKSGLISKGVLWVLTLKDLNNSTDAQVAPIQKLVDCNNCIA
ncbi:hypothetical protein AGMMS49921_12730 [Endomicrobiia bacterium]|nr:hypothetical protein AGMMS49921_12730 [Endomicrobiia bacterium]